MADTEKPGDIDPRHRMAQRYLQTARDDLAAKEAEKPKPQRRRPTRLAEKPTLADLKPSIAASTVVHAILLSAALSAGFMTVTICFAIMDSMFLVGRVIALPAGILMSIGLSYASAFFLGVIESTSHGYTTPDDMLTGDWRDWFWTLPSTLGVLFMATMLGWLISRVAPDSTWMILGISVWLCYPVLQLSTLETGSFTAPISLPVLGTLATRPLIWISLFGISFVLGRGVYQLTQITWPQRPLLTAFLLGPIAAVALFVYAWLLGQVARWLTIGGR